MTVRPDGRCQVTVTMLPEIYDRLHSRCDEIDQPITVFVRELIKRELNKPAVFKDS